MMVQDPIGADAARLRESGSSFHAIAAELNRRALPAPLGGRWYGATVRRMLQRALKKTNDKET
ncbi:MAG: recombinase family protein [Pseudomonadota bacterium]